MTASSIAVPACAEPAATLNGLLRSELSAVRTYDLALTRFGGHPRVVTRLEGIRDEHSESVRVLRELVARYGGSPAEDGEPWAAFVCAVTGTTVGPAAVLATLEEGEQSGIADYRRALDSGVPAECRDSILNDLLPRCEEHIAYLDDLQAAVSYSV